MFLVRREEAAVIAEDWWYGADETLGSFLIPRNDEGFRAHAAKFEPGKTMESFSEVASM